MTAAIDTFLRRFFLVIAAVCIAAIELLIAYIWSNVSLCCFGLSTILAFHFPHLFIFQCIPLFLALRKKPSLSLSLSVQAFSSLVLYHQSSLTSFVDTTRKISLTVISYNHHCRQYPKINIKKNLTDPTSHHLVGTKANSSSKSIAIVRHWWVLFVENTEPN